MTADPPTPRDIAAGRELDVLVAEKVMGWQMAKRPNGEGWPPSQYWQGLHHRKVPPPYSTDISAAWTVVEHWREQTLSLRLDVAWVVGGGKPWRVEVWLPEMSDSVVEMADTAPLAICRAALKAVSG